MTTWQTMTLRQFQAIAKVQESAMDDLEKQTEILSILTGKTPRELDGVMVTDYRKLCGQMTKLLDIKGKMPGKVERNIGPFQMVYEIQDLTQGQWVTLMHFTKDGKPIQNAHLILATVVKPKEKGLLSYFRKAKPNDPAKHSQYAEALLDCPVIDIYHSCLFFCQMFRNFLADMKGYLTSQLMKAGVGQAEAVQTILDSIHYMDGFIQQNKLLNSTA